MTAMKTTSFALAAIVVFFNTAVTVPAQKNFTVFGRSQTSEAALIGIMYDLKQTQTHEPTSVDPERYTGVVDEFLASKWDERVLNRYYRVTKPVYTTQIFVPNMNADEAPKAFGAEKTVKPSRWIIHYKGQVSPPSPGTYRFWGSADDALAVAVNGVTELSGCRPDMHLVKTGWKQTGPNGARAANGSLHPGDWFTVGANEIIDLDVIIGERPGGEFNAFLMIEKKGESYQSDGEGHAILPIFQVAPYQTPVSRGEPKFAVGYPVWKCYQ
jgi:hypothetical protein